VVTALNLEPPSLNLYLGLGAPYSTGIVSDQILASAYHDVGKEGRSVPDLIVGDPKITTTPFTLTYTIKKQARWSDATPVTAGDFASPGRSLRDRRSRSPTRRASSTSRSSAR